MNWFSESIQRHGNTVDALIPSLLEWFESADYRSCAFINSVGEFGETMPEVIELSQQHKQDMSTFIATLLADSANKQNTANALSLAVDGAIIRSQIDQDAQRAIAGLSFTVEALVAKG